MRGRTWWNRSAGPAPFRPLLVLLPYVVILIALMGTMYRDKKAGLWYEQTDYNTASTN